MLNFEATIGIEVHVALNTKTKMFSASPVSATSEPNTNINEIDMGLPGALPSPNVAACKKAIMLAHALKMQIATTLSFDRKNYFYYDLPKGYQITQHVNPIGKNGVIDVGGCLVHIEQIQLEEDTAKQIDVFGKLCLDYNRSGVPLIEIISKPDMHTAEEALAYLNQLRLILIYLDISDAKMENGSFRADINVSVTLRGAKTLGTKVEIKNINSFNNIKDAINYEIERQQKQLLNNELITPSTRRWDETKHQTIFMREKTTLVGYHYFPEPNIMPIDIHELVVAITKKVPELPSDALAYLLNKNINKIIAEQIVDDFNLYKLFKIVLEATNLPNQTINWVVNELPFYLKQSNKGYDSCSPTLVNNIIELIKLIDKQEINNKQAKTIFEKMYSSNESPKSLIEKLNFKQITDPTIIRQHLTNIIKQNASVVATYKQNPTRVVKLLIGLLMKETQGQANPIVANDVLIELINSYNNFNE
ncbi:MAG: Asp-tRNA(Asn)/Glu-tRNA(Gln) amidotransferase subunit GatB [Mycoplasmataceae bacterium]|nr:Asp-tRNA(Asn)/Glu-tRNA(Gln) amidotransferase subunit GatB [Mycoplasmataceae bacterium]